jgi:hypothetical protein
MGMTRSPGAPGTLDVPRSLADDLRVRSDEALAMLLRARPDLISPVPGDLGILAVRATTRSSVQRALDRLDRFTLQAVDVLCVLPDPATTAAVTTLLGAPAGPPVEVLRTQALLYGPDDALRLVRTVREAVGSPAGLGPPAEQVLAQYGPSRLGRLLDDLGLARTGDPVSAATAIAARLADPLFLDEMLAQSGPQARVVLDRLTWGPPTGQITDAHRQVSIDSARTPVERLLARALLVATGSDEVVLPREAALRLRGGRVHAEPAPAPPALATTRRVPAHVDRTAGGSAFTILRHVEDLLETWGVAGPLVLRAGGLGVRDLRRAASVLDLDETATAFAAELAYVAGLLAPNGEIEETWRPTPAYDAWRGQDPGQRWATLAAGWLRTTRLAGLVGTRDERDRPLSALGPDLDRAMAPDVRAAVLAELAALPPGTVAGAEAITERLAWFAPRRGGRLRPDAVTWTLREAEALGVVGLGALAAPGRALIADPDDEAAIERVLVPLLPVPLDHVLLQADLTAVAPGPLETELARELALLADVESTGGATVFRLTDASVRRALDAGRSAEDVHRLLAARSRTPVPQPLTYLVDDVARRHGRIRVGTASAYVRADDPGVLAELVADRRTAQLRLRRLAPTVLAAQAPVDVVLARLRELGFAPAAETPEGDLLVRRPDSLRSPRRQPPPRVAGEPAPPRDAVVAAAVRALRAGDRAATAVRRPLAGDAGPDAGRGNGPVPRTATVETLSALQAAADGGDRLWIGYVDNEGSASQRVIEPITVEGGQVSAFDHRRGEVATFAIHRITGVAALDPPTPTPTPTP